MIEPLLEILHDDRSAMIRERLLEYTEDCSLDSETRNWVFQALRDITGQTLPPDPSTWRLWHQQAR